MNLPGSNADADAVVGILNLYRMRLRSKEANWLVQLLHTWIGCEEVSLPFRYWLTQASLINEQYVVCGYIQQRARMQKWPILRKGGCREKRSKWLRCRRGAARTKIFEMIPISILGILHGMLLIDREISAWQNKGVKSR